MEKITLDHAKIKEARRTAKRIADDTGARLAGLSSVSIERAICRLFGIDGVDKAGVPLPNLLVDHLVESKTLDQGAAWQIAKACVAYQSSPQALAERFAQGEPELFLKAEAPRQAILEKARKLAKEAVDTLRKHRKEREALLERYGDRQGPLLYVIVATGNIYEDMVQAKAAARQGADIIAVIRSTGQSLLDFVPYGATTEGFGGTMATQENFRLMREALDEVGEDLGRYIRLCNYCSGLCMSEIAVMGAFERLDVMLNDALYGILFRDINMQRTLLDQNFSRLINAAAGVIINTGEDNYLTTADAFEEAHTVLASQFINEQFALQAGLPEEQMGLGHAFEMDPELEDSFLYELAQAQMARQIFPKAPLKYMPPTRYMQGNIFMGHVQDTLFNIVTVLTDQRLHLLGMMTEAIHTPFMSDRALAIDNARYMARAMRGLADEISYKKGGRVEARAALVLDKALELLKEMAKNGLFYSLETGLFASIKRPIDGGKGLSGVFAQGPDYLNPFEPLLREECRAIKAEQEKGGPPCKRTSRA